MTDETPAETKKRSKHIYWAIALALVLIGDVGLQVYREFFVPEECPPMKNIPDMTPGSWEYTGDLHWAVKGATRLRVHTLGPYSSDDKARVLYETTDQKAIAVVADRISFKKRSLKSCYTHGGDPVLEWYKGEELLARVPVLHGKALRWRGHWPGDADLTPESSKWLCAWLRRIGVDSRSLPDKMRR